MMVFGGTLSQDGNESNFLNDVWVLEKADGTSGIPAWSQLVTDIAPPARNLHTAVYDPNTNRMIVFGGQVGASTRSNEVWMLENADGTDGITPTKWTKLSPSGGPPSPRDGHSAIYDAVNNRMIIFGGQDNEVWVLENANGLENRQPATPKWLQLTPDPDPNSNGGAPIARSLHSAVYDAVTNRMIIFGGCGTGAGGCALGDLWILENANGLDSNGQTATPKWTQISPQGGPTARGSHNAVYDTNTNRMIVFGGNPNVGTGDFSSLVTDVWVLENANGLDSNGKSTTPDEKPITPKWTRLSPAEGPPSGRKSHTSVFNVGNNRMIVFSGQLNETWVLDNANGLRLDGAVIPEWVEFPLDSGTGSTRNSPVARNFHVAAYSVARKRMIVFGGCETGSGKCALNDVWVLENADGLDADGQLVIPKWTELSLTGGPTARGLHTAVYDTNSNRMIVFGGDENAGSTGAKALKNDVWVLENADNSDETVTANWRQLNPTGGPPSPRSGHTSVYDGLRNRMIVFGGQDGEVWVLEDANGLTDNGTVRPKWTQLFPTPDPENINKLPTARNLHSAVYDSTTNRMVIYGGCTTDTGKCTLGDLWILENANGLDSDGQIATPRWREISFSGGPRARGSHTAAFDPNTNRMILFGGSANASSREVISFTNDVWTLQNANGLNSAGESAIPNWTKLFPSDGPRSPRIRHTAEYNFNLASNRMTVFGGHPGCPSCEHLNNVWLLINANGIIPPGEPVFGTPTTTEEEDQTQIATSSVDVTEAPASEVTEADQINLGETLPERTGAGVGGPTTAREEPKAPIIKILGPNPATIRIGAEYKDSGATALDSRGEDLTGQIITTSNVNTKVPGRYIVVFKVTDANGKTATATRTVNVVGASIPDTTIVSAQDGAGRFLRSGARTTSTSITFSFTGSDDTGLKGFECSLDSAEYTACISPKRFSKLPLGSRGFKVRAINLLGEEDPSPASFVWSVLSSGAPAPPAGEFVLLGTFIAGTQRRAIVRAKSGELIRLAPGEAVDGFEIAEIHKQRAVLKGEDSTLELILDFTRR